MHSRICFVAENSFFTFSCNTTAGGFSEQLLMPPPHPPPTHTYAPFFGIFLCQLRLHAAISVAAKLVRAYWVCPLPFPWPQQYWGSRVLQSRQLTIHSRSAKNWACLFLIACAFFFFLRFNTARTPMRRILRRVLLAISLLYYTRLKRKCGTMS